jgi:hypothetical protein
MGLFSDIISAVGNVFGGGDDSSSDDQQKRKQNTPAPQNNNLVSSKVNLPSVLKAPQNNLQAPKALKPVFTQPAPAPTNLTAGTPPPPAPSGGGLFHDLTHNPVTNVVGHDIISPTVNAGKDVGEVAAAAVPEVGLGAGRVGTGIVQGLTQIPHIATALTATGTKELAKTGLPGTTEANNLVQDANTGVKTATNFVDRPINAASKGIDTAAADYSKLGPLAGMGEQDYKDTQVPLNILAGLATLGGGTAAEAAGEGGDAANAAGKTNLITKGIDFLNKDVANPANDVISKVGSGVSNAVAPVIHAVNSPVSSVIKGVKAIIPGGESADEAAGANADKVTPETGTKAVGVDKPANAPSGESAGVPQAEPGAIESGVKPVESQTDTPPAPAEPAAPAAAPVAGAPALTATGDTTQDLQNATGAVKNVLENGRDITPEANTPGKNILQSILDTANAHLNANGTLSKIVNSRLASHLNDTEAANVRDAIETGNAKNLTAKEAAAHDAIKQNIEQPSNMVRTNLSKDYQQADNHFPQVRQSSVKSAVSGASKAKGLGNKINTFQDLLNRDSRFSQGSSLGKFTSGTKSVTGDAGDLGLVAKKDGTFVDKSGKVYQYSRATSSDLEKSGVKLQAPKDALTAYTRDTLNLKTRADAADYLVKNSDHVGLSDTEVPGKTVPLTIKASDGTDHNFFTDSKTAKDIKGSGILGNFSKDANLPVRAWNALSSVITQGVVANPTVDSINRVVNGVIGSGIRKNGVGGLTTLKGTFSGLDDAKRLQMEEAGVHFPSFGKNTQNIVSKATGGLSKLNEKAISAVDAHVRSGMFDSLKKGGMTDKQAAQQINRVLGGRGTYNKDAAQLGMFWKYFVRQNANAAKLFSNAAKGHPGELINAAGVAAATYGADKGLQAATGNKGAYVHAPGMIGAANDVVKTVDQVKNHDYQQLAVNNPVINHINPLIPTAAEQILGVNQYGDKFANPSARLANAEEITPETNVLNNNGRSDVEKAANTFGVYTPHIAGNMATDNPKLAPILNVKNAQNGSSTAFPKDFTGEQEAAQVDKLGSNYSSKSAAILGTQTQSQQQKYLQATTTLKKYGITDATDVENFSKLNSKDQGSYVDAVDQLNKAGTAVSTSTVQSQLVKNGNVALAAGINKDIPNQLPQDQKNALETYSTLGSDGQKSVWLQDNNNAASYYPALIAQKQASGALTTDDTDMSTAWSGSGGTLYVDAAVAKTNQQNNVPQSLVELYKNTTKTEFEGTSTTGVNVTSAQQAELAQYAQQLAANGVDDKFGIADGTGGSSSSGYSSSGTSSSDLDRAAGLPDGTQTLVKPKDNSNLKVADTVKYAPPQILADKPSTKDGNPFIRSISFSKGLK